MKLIIDIPEVFYEALRKTNVIITGQRSGKTLASVIYSAVANGIPLPKGHGRLIDADDKENLTICFDDRGVIKKIEAPTIIEADRNEVSE